MNIIRFAIDNPVKVSVGVLMVLLFGFIALTQIPVQLTPDVDQPIIQIETSWFGRSPEEIETEIIEPQEDVLKDVAGLTKMTATALEGQATVELEFAIGTDPKDARQEVSDSLREVPEYPDDAEEPVIKSSSGSEERPIAWLILSYEKREFDIQKLGDLAEERIKPYLERVPGVSEVRVYGGREREVQIEVDPDMLAQRRITFNALRDALALKNINTSAGNLEEGISDVRIRTIGQYEQLDQVRETVIGEDAGVPIRIRDVANVKYGYEKRRAFVRSRGQIALALPVIRQTGANVIRTMDELKVRIGEVNERILPSIAEEVRLYEGMDEAPKLELRQVYDETVYIDDALDLVQTNLFIGGSLAGLMLLLFLRSFRPTFIVALAIPLSIIGTFVVMAAAGRNINVISLAGLAFAVGMVVDAAIVVLENIDRHLGMGKKPIIAAYDGTREVWGAILASAATTLAVFIPVLLIQEEAGQLFRDIALAICAAVSLSLVVSVTVIPASSARILRHRDRPESALVKMGHSLFGLATAAGAFARHYAQLLYHAMAPNPAGVAVRLGVVGAFTIVAMVGAMLLMPPTDYLPRGNQNIVFGFLITPPGYNLDHLESIAHNVEADVDAFWEADTYQDTEAALAAYAQRRGRPMTHPFTQQPVQNLPPVDNFFFVSGFFGTFLGSTSQDKDNVAPLGDMLTAQMMTVPGSIGFAQQVSLFGRGISGTRSIEVEVVGANLDEVRDSAAALRGTLMQVFGPMVMPDPMNFDKAAPEMQVDLDEVKAAELRINTTDLGLGVRALVDGITVGDYRFRGDSLDIVAKRDPLIDMPINDLPAVPLAYTTPTGETGVVYLSQVARMKRTGAPQSIRRVEEQRAVTLTVTPPDQMPLEKASELIEKKTQELQEAGAIRPSVVVQQAGSANKLADVREALLGEWHGFTFESIRSLGLSRIFLALLVVYLLMAALFESYLYPFVIMFSVPLATVGGFIGLFLVHAVIPTQSLDVVTMLGFVILIGVVVNNAILIVHQALNFMRGVGEGEGDTRGRLPAREAIRESVRIRIRPVFMTTATSVSGMLPLVLSPGSGSELYRGLGSVVVGGLIVSTVFTLIVVPLLFSLVVDAKMALYRWRGWSLEDMGITD